MVLDLSNCSNDRVARQRTSTTKLEHRERAWCGLRLEAAWTKNRQPEFQLWPLALVGALYTSARSGAPQRSYVHSYARLAGMLRCPIQPSPCYLFPSTNSRQDGPLYRPSRSRVSLSQLAFPRAG